MQDAIKNEVICDKRIRSLYLECKKRKMQIESAINSETMSLEQYVDKLKTQETKDDGLYDYFKSSGDMKKAAIVKERLDSVREELADM